MRLSTAQKAIIALIITNTIWGAAAPLFKWSLLSTPPFTLAILRFSIGALILYPFVRHHLKIKIKDLPALLLLSIIGVTVNISFFFLALQHTDSINAPIIASSGPIFLILFGITFLKDKLKKKTLIGGLLGLLGVIIIVVIPSIEKGVDASFLGNMFLIVAMFATVIHTILSKKIIRHYNPLTIVFWSFIIGSLGFLPMFLQEVQTVGFLPVINMQVVTGILFGAFLASALAYFLQTWAIKKMPVEDVGLFTYMDPVVAIIIAYPLLGEIPTIHFFIGSVLVFGGIFIAEGRLHWHLLQKLKG